MNLVRAEAARNSSIATESDIFITHIKKAPQLRGFSIREILWHLVNLIYHLFRILGNYQMMYNQNT